MKKATYVLQLLSILKFYEEMVRKVRAELLRMEDPDKSV